MYIDISILLFILLVVFFTMKKGFFMEIFQLSSLIIAYFTAKRFYAAAANLFLRSMENTGLKMILSYGIVFFVSFVLCLIIFSVLKNALGSDSGVKAVDKTMGALWGVLKALIIIEIVIILLLRFEVLTPEDVERNSLIGRLLIGISRSLNVLKG